MSRNPNMMDALSRRTFHQGALQSILTYSLLETLCASDAFARAVKPVITTWLADLNQLGNDVKDQKLKQLDWQQKVEQLFAKVDLPELLELIDFEKLTKNVKFVGKGARSLRFRFPEVEGIPKKLVFGKQIFALKRERSVIPHGHNNMATAFLVLQGECHGRHYDRLADEPKHILIKPTIDKNFKAGGYSTVSDEKDNIHWFQAASESAFIFNIHVLNIRPGSQLPTGRVYLDPHGEKISGGRIRARRIGYDEANKLFG